jgi:hypothetical protein
LRQPRDPPFSNPSSQQIDDAAIGGSARRFMDR